MPGDDVTVHSAARAGEATYLPELDGLRAVSIGLVVASHLGLGRVVPGAFGVTLFFFISGYLITRQLKSTLDAAGRLDFKGFYARRALRLLPAAAVYTALAGGAFTLAGGRISPAGWAAAAAYGANYYELWAGYRSTLAGVRHPFNILWSLAIEEHFYLLWPLALALLWRRGWAVGALLGVCAAVLAWRLYLLGVCFTPGAPGLCGAPNPNPLWRFNRLYLATDTRLDSIAWGALLALLPARGAGRAAWLGLALVAVSFTLPGPLGRHVLRPTLQGVGLLAAFPLVLAARPAWLRARAAVLTGRLSYSLYLWHWGALGVADTLAPDGGVRWFTVAVPLAAGLACASYWGIERPMLRVRRRFGSHAPLALAGQDGPVCAPPPEMMPHATHRA
jgi:peptidoglycan/LPS O-acetylase OafA/YrhL